MTKHIASVKKSICEIVHQITRTNENLKLRLAMEGYRDFGYGAKQFEVLDFVPSIDAFTGFVARIVALRVASGGGDAPEDMAGAIQKANGLKWASPTRVVFLIADFPCHGSEFHSLPDNYPGGSPGVDIKSEIRNLVSNHGNGSMTVYFGRITKHTDSMLRRFEELGTPLEVISMADVSKLTASVTKGVRKSIFKTMTVTGGGSRSFAFTSLDDTASLLKGRLKSTSVSLKDYCILPRLPSALEWTKRESLSVKVFRNKEITSIDDLQAPIGIEILRFPHARTNKTSEFLMQMRRAAEPFAEGEIRIAYHGQLSRNVADLAMERSAMVMKSFKHIGEGLNDRQQYLKQMEVSNIADFLARMYNKSSYRPEHCARIHVLQVCVVEEEGEFNEKSGSRRFCTEAPLPTDGSAFIKYSNNTGYWDVDHIDESLLQFSDFSFIVTRKYLMVTDLQGVRVGNTCFLTDPVILCEDILRFGRTNLGGKFMKKCNDSIQALMSENGWC